MTATTHIINEPTAIYRLNFQIPLPEGVKPGEQSQFTEEQVNSIVGAFEAHNNVQLTGDAALSFRRHIPVFYGSTW